MPDKIFSKIALSLSGGGYRATAFHLGTLSFLQHAEFTQADGTTTSLLDRVKVLSTISGGTFTGVMWAYHNSKGEPFTTCFQKLYQLLAEENLIEAAFDKLNGKRPWRNPNKTKKLINAFAEVYNDDFFDQASFESITGKDSQLTIDDVSFNATEFKHGLAFRFQNQGLFGNYYVNLEQNHVQEIKLGDIVASSSCFPGGFEPLIFPNDYIQTKDGALAKHWKERTGSDTPIAIMDGGIIDNQGIDGVRLAEERLEKKREKDTTVDTIDTFIASDVEGKKIQGFTVPKPDASTSKLTVNTIRGKLTISLMFLFLLFVASIWMVVAQGNLWWIIGIVLTSIFGLAGLLGRYIIDRAEKFVEKSSEEAINESGTDLMLELGILFNTPIHVLKNLIKLRIGSTLTMTNEIFLKRIRSIQYQSLYSGDSPWRKKMIGNFLYSLLDKDRIGDLSAKSLHEVKQAKSMPTTLWFSEEEQKDKMLDSLVITGQMTICRKLIEYIDKKRDLTDYEERYSTLLPSIDKLYISLEKSWKQFNENPRWLLDKTKSIKG